MPGINFHKTYLLSDEYEYIKVRAKQVLEKYVGYPELITFNHLDRSVTFCTERLIPAAAANRPRVMLLFSNPHPHSVHQGMFLSPNTHGQENLFWPVMHNAGWMPIPKENRNPKQLAKICLGAKYGGPFALLFNCYYAFPTPWPKQVREIFGSSYFSQSIEPEAMHEFRKTIEETAVDAVVTFNKGIFNLVSKDKIERYIDRLKEDKLIRSQLKDFHQSIPIFLTFPTGWHFHKDWKRLRVRSLKRIQIAIHR